MKKLYFLCSLLVFLVACSQKPATGNEGSEAASENVSATAADSENYPTYIDLELPNTDGDIVKLSDYVGKSKYLLIDFWASWCGPCRAEMPYVVRAYNEYHAKGFNVVGISLDTKAEMWKKAISDMQMAWPQMSDLSGWDSKAAATYGVNSIPASFLLDEQGHVIAVNLRGDALLNKLGELLR